MTLTGGDWLEALVLAVSALAGDRATELVAGLGGGAHPRAALRVQELAGLCRDERQALLCSMFAPARHRRCLGQSLRSLPASLRAATEASLPLRLRSRDSSDAHPQPGGPTADWGARLALEWSAGAGGGPSPRSAQGPSRASDALAAEGLHPSLARFLNPTAPPMEVTEPEPLPRPPSPPTLAVRRLTRAHLAVARRPELWALGRRLLERCGAGLTSALGCSVELTSGRLEASPRARPGDGVFAVLELTALGAAAVLELEPALGVALAAALAGGRAPGAPVSALTPLESVALGYLVLAALAELRSVVEAEQLWAARLSGWTDAGEVAFRSLGDGPLLAFSFRLSSGETRGTVRLTLAASTLCASIGELEVAPLPPLGEGLARATVQAALLGGVAHLDRAAARALRLGDVVVLPGLRLGPTGPAGGALLRTDAFVLEGNLSPEGFTVHAARLPVVEEEETMSSAEPSDLPVDLEVELARVRLPLSQLAGLRIGAVLPLRVGAGEPVLLRLGGRAVGRAELVDVEGELGARVLSLFD